MTTITRRAVRTEPSGDNFGYRPELKRSLGSFQVFAISFASVSVIIGIFSTFGDVLPVKSRRTIQV